MNILIVTAWYAPFIHPRAHRWSALAEHWASEGHAVQVLTARLRERPGDEWLNGVRVHRVGFDSLKEWVYHGLGLARARGRVGLLPQRAGRGTRLLEWAYRNLWKRVYFPDDACLWYLPARKKMRQLLENQHFDWVITVSLPFTGHLLGLTFFPKKHLPGTSPAWLADIGDPFSFQAKPPNNPLFFAQLNQKFERRVLETAQLVTVTTDATRQKYRQAWAEKVVDRMHVVPPLALPWLPVPPSRPSSGLAIGYFGALYAPTRTPDAFLDLLTRTFAQRRNGQRRLDIHFYGEIFSEFYEKLRAQPAIRLHGLRSREEARAAMQQMDILLHIGNTTDFQLPSKAVDYLASGKPILHLSYTEQDPFLTFFEGNPMVFSLKIDQGKVSPSEFERWMVWLESEKPVPDSADLAAQIAPFLLENVAKQYLGLMTAASPG